jgi:co-chaperonin GroES (HSP10)
MTTAPAPAKHPIALNDYVVVKLRKVTAGDLAIPDVAVPNSRFGEVVSAGPGRKLKGGFRTDTEVKPGEIVALPLYGGTAIDLDGVHYIIIRCVEILAVVPSETVQAE